MNDDTTFSEGFLSLTGKHPFAWQQRLFADFVADSSDAPRIPQALDIATGLGKTSVIAIWLLALAARAAAGDPPLPRRLVYVVDRRTVVDQATDVALAIRDAVRKADGEDAAARVKQALGRLCADSTDDVLAISTLRGELADNREWQSDPTRPAIIVGTVDMIGSRLLFSGYGVSRRMRPFHAGLIGADTLVVLDEAHLVPPFQALLEGVLAITSDGRHPQPLVPRLRVMTLSATGRHSNGKLFRLEKQDEGDPVVAKRLSARKSLRLEELSDEAGLAHDMAERAWQRSEGGHRVIVFCDSRRIAQDIYQRLTERLGRKAAKPSVNVELIVGARRVHERERLAASEVFQRFSPSASSKAPVRIPEATGPAFLIATSAGEVGIDLDADHMVSDLVAWERMVQRLGRVNRLGDFANSLVDVFPMPSEKDRDAETPADATRLGRWRAPFDTQHWTRDQDGRLDASPRMLRRLRDDPDFAALIAKATTPEPLRPALTHELVDAWSMTSLEEHPGRPDVSPWIRGWVEEEPQTRVIWRRVLPVRAHEDEASARHELAEYFEAAPPHISEVLEDRTSNIVKLLQERAKALLKPVKGDKTEVSEGAASDEGNSRLGPASIAAVVLSQSRDIDEVLDIRDIDDAETRHLLTRLQGRTVVLDARLGGLDPSGLANSKKGEAPSTLDGGGWNDEELELIGFRVRTVAHGTDDAAEWRVAYSRLFEQRDDEGDDISSALEWRVEEWIGEAADRKDPALARTEQGLAEHQSLATQWADKISARLSLPQDHSRMLAAAAAAHDDGKARSNWQAYAGNPGFERDPVRHPPRAKFKTRPNPALLRIGEETYRHEFGSLHDVAARDGLKDIASSELRDLALHLIAAHHGNTRPVIVPVDQSVPPTASLALAREAALRFARLQRHWGPWGLAWWEALLRAADAGASRELDRRRGNG